MTNSFNVVNIKMDILSYGQTEKTTDQSESSIGSKDGFFSVKNQTVVTIVTLLVRHLQSCSCNAYEIDELVRDPNFMSANRNER